MLDRKHGKQTVLIIVNAIAPYCFELNNVLAMPTGFIGGAHLRVECGQEPMEAKRSDWIECLDDDTVIVHKTQPGSSEWGMIFMVALWCLYPGGVLLCAPLISGYPMSRTQISLTMGGGRRNRDRAGGYGHYLRQIRTRGLVHRQRGDRVSTEARASMPDRLEKRGVGEVAVLASGISGRGETDHSSTRLT